MGIVNFSDPFLAGKLLDNIRHHAAKLGPVNIMEVCGTHTMEIGRLGLRSLLPKNITLTSGPGCPVCVTPGSVIDAAAGLSFQPSTTVLTFGDMLRVPGIKTSLEAAQMQGGSVEIVTSPLQAVSLARTYLQKQFVFIAVGFETTVPVVARAITVCKEKKLTNCSFLISHRIVPPALDALIDDPELNISGFLLPGHVSAVIGVHPYHSLIARGTPAAITGFEALDILSGVQSVIAMLAAKTVAVTNRYPRVVKEYGNPIALQIINDVFKPVDAVWRGIGTIPGSGLALREKYSVYDACYKYPVLPAPDTMPDGCSCGEVLKGKINPSLCPLFGNACTPASPVGPCMVSSEGSCAAYHRYGG